MHLEVLLFIFSLVFDFIAGLCLPKPVLVCLLVLKLLLVAFGNGSCIPIASGESVVGSLWVLILEQICHLMQNSKAHPVVGFDLLKALRHCFHKWLKVHSELGSFYLDGCNWIFVTASIRLLSIHDCLKYLWLFLDLILSLALFGCKLQKVKDGKWQCVLFFFFLRIANVTLLVLLKNYQSLRNCCEAELSLEEICNNSILLLCIADQVGQNVEDDWQDELSLARPNVLRGHKL